MASLPAIRAALTNTVTNGVALELFAYPEIPDVAQLPALVVQPVTADYNGEFQRGMHTWMFNVFVLVRRMDVSSAQDVLDQFITGSGDNSIPRALYERADLGLNDGTDATVIKMTGYGGHFAAASIDHVGAILQVRVITDGRS